MKKISIREARVGECYAITDNVGQRVAVVLESILTDDTLYPFLVKTPLNTRPFAVRELEALHPAIEGVKA